MGDEATKDGGSGHAHDDEEADEDDVVLSRPDPKSQLYTMKMANWTAKFEKYRGLGKKRKADHYQKMILFYPPMPPGHKLLRGYYEALCEEYKGGAHQVDDWTTIWFDTTSDDDFEDGTDRDSFKRWMDVTESMIAEKLVSTAELEGHWGLKKEPVKAAVAYPQPAPLQAYPTAQPMGAAFARPQAVPVAQPAYAQPYPAMARPAVAAQPAMQYVRPGGYPQAAGYPGAVAPPIYGGPMPQMMGTAMYSPQMAMPSISVNVNYGR